MRIRKIRTSVMCSRTNNKTGLTQRDIENCKLCKYHDSISEGYVRCKYPTKKKPKLKKGW